MPAFVIENMLANLVKMDVIKLTVSDNGVTFALNELDSI